MASNQVEKERAQLDPAGLGCCAIQETDSAVAWKSKMFICIKQAETDQGSLNNDFSKYSQAIPSTPIIGIHQKMCGFIIRSKYD